MFLKKQEHMRKKREGEVERERKMSKREKNSKK
jgi:hypothetical protein